MERPSGAGTFLFTDIEGSTRLWEQHPGEMAGVLAEHDRLVREAIESHDGRVFSTAGDAFAAMFPSAGAAVATAVAAQQTTGILQVASEPVRVRMAVHCGEVEERDEGFFGPVLNRCARLRDTAYGGQILLTSAVHEQFEGASTSGVSLVDLGEHRLRDLSAPERVFQVNAPGLPTDFPPIRSLGAFIHNLPTQFTSFVGRWDEINGIGKSLADTRHVTLVGPGGSGKTRLGLQAAAEFLDRYPDGTWYVDLRSIDDPADLPRLVASTLRIALTGERPIADQIVDALADRRLLVMLDNCEHVIEAAGALVDPMLRRRGKVHVLATTRQPLGIPDESLLAVQSLPVPASIGSDPLDGSEAIRLFTDRASSARPGFRVADHLPAVFEICRTVDGLPLAIELAAARLRGLSPEELAGRLDSQLAVLKTSRTTGDLRHATMEGTIAWSWDLLDPPEQTLFARLAFFPGTWSLESAEAICGYDPIDPSGVLDLQTSLLDKSLVTLDETAGPVTRYRMLEPIRQYGEQQLGDDTKQELRHRHIDHWRKAFPITPIDRRTNWDRFRRARRVIPTVAPDSINLNAAMEWALEAGRYEDTMRILGGGFGVTLEMDGHGFEPVSRWMDTSLRHTGSISNEVLLLALDNAYAVAASSSRNEKAVQWARLGAEASSTPRVRHHFLQSAGVLLGRLGHTGEGLALLDAIITDTDDPATRASALFWKTEQTGGAARWRLMQEALSIAPIEDLDAHSDAFAWLRFSDAAAAVARYATAIDAAQRALELTREVDHRVMVFGLGVTIARLLTDQGRFDEARQHIDEVLPVAKQILGKSPATRQFLCMAADCARMWGEHGKARSLIDEVRSVIEPGEESRVLVQMSAAEVARDTGDLDGADRLLNDAARVFSDLEGDSPDFYLWYIRGIQATVAIRRHDPDRALVLQRDGLVHEIGHTSALGRLDLFAITLIQNGQPESGARIIGFVDHERDRTGLVVPPPDREIRESAIEEGRAVMGGDWDSATAEGSALTLDEAVDVARGLIEKALSGQDPGQDQIPDPR